MKTELITNVSHDLKTPLTAIITYVNLLKDEKDEEKKKEYVDVLERKSMRLKVLIEDLFDISKASSKNITLNLMQSVGNTTHHQFFPAASPICTRSEGYVPAGREKLA